MNLIKLGISNSKLYSNKFPSESEAVGLCKYQVELDKFKRGLELGAAEVWLYQYDHNHIHMQITKATMTMVMMMMMMMMMMTMMTQNVKTFSSDIAKVHRILHHSKT